jgi:glycosyltransferase involved in cell wall biosynthesis
VNTSIIIRAKDEEGSIGEVLEGIFSQTYDGAFEVVLVDSGSADRTSDIARSFPVRVVTIAPERFTFGYALNYGIRNSSGDVICCLSAHCTPCHDRWLAALTGPVRGGNAQATYGRQVPVRGMNPFEELFLLRRFPESGAPAGRVPFSNANCSFLRTMWDEVKFDEQIPSWEDYLWYLLTRERFVFRYAPEASVFHSHPFSLRRIAKTAYQDGRAFRYMENRYRMPVTDRVGSARGKVRYALQDLAGHGLFFLRRAYVGHLLMLPFVKCYAYLQYWRGYRSCQ